MAQFLRISRIGDESQHNRELSCELRVVAYHFHSFIKWIEIAFYGQLQFILSSNASSSIAIQWHRMLEFENIRHSVHFLVAVELNLDIKLISTDYQWPSRKCFIFVDTCLPIEYELDITKSNRYISFSLRWAIYRDHKWPHNLLIQNSFCQRDPVCCYGESVSEILSLSRYLHSKFVCFYHHHQNRDGSTSRFIVWLVSCLIKAHASDISKPFNRGGELKWEKK